MGPRELQALSPASSPPHSSDTSFPILTISIAGILATALLLVIYYVFAVRRSINWHRVDLLRRLYPSQRRNHHDPLMVYASSIESRGLDESVIRSIPTFRFQMGTNRDYECSVCLNEFQPEEMLRIIPNCSHVFHIDCIDVWLQNNTNCPLCRASISSAPPYMTVAPPNRVAESAMGGDEDFVVIELGGENETTATAPAPAPSTLAISPSPKKRGQEKGRKLKKVTSLGDECIDIRGNEFRVQPVRRSVSMDSSADRGLYLAVQEIVGNIHRGQGEGEGEGRTRRLFFSFGNGSSRGFRSSSVLPLPLDP